MNLLPPILRLSSHRSIRYTVFAIRYTVFAIRDTGMAGHMEVARGSTRRQNGYLWRRRFGSSPTGRGWGSPCEETKNCMGATSLPNATCVGGVPQNISEPDRSPWWDGVFQLHADVIWQLQMFKRPDFAPHPSNWIKLEETDIRRREACFDNQVSETNINSVREYKIDLTLIFGQIMLNNLVLKCISLTSSLYTIHAHTHAQTHTHAYTAQTQNHHTYTQINKYM